MICPLYTLMEEYKDRKLYVWNINRTSMIMFTKIAFMRIDIEGFVAAEEEYAGQIYMNRPVISIKDVMQENNCIVLVSDEVLEESISMLPEEKRVYWSQAQGFNEELLHDRIIIYGIGYGAGKLDELLASRGTEAELYCVTKRTEVTQHNGKKVLEAAELDTYKDYSVIISVKSEKDSKEILDTLSDFQGKIYVEHIIDRVAFFHLNFFQTLDLASKERKKIYIYGKKNKIGELIEEILEIYGIENSGYIYGEDIKEQGIKDIFSIALEGIEDKIVIIGEILPRKLIEARENIELAGFSLEQGNYIGMEGYTAEDDNLSYSMYQVFDSLVGISIMYPHGRAGWKLYGREEQDSIKIVVLGGSTSSEVYHPENWVSKLYYKMQRHNIKTTIYNGAHTADDIVDEMLRLLRDINVLQPHIVISMSGVNNLAYKESVNQFNETRFLGWTKGTAGDKEYCTGVRSEESLFTFWNRNQRLLQAISEFYGAVFVGFLQPMNITMEHMDMREKSLYELEHRIIGARDFARLAESGYGYVNLMKMFEHQNDMYIDAAHYSAKAQQRIADKVYEIIEPILQKMQR